MAIIGRFGRRDEAQVVRTAVCTINESVGDFVYLNAPATGTSDERVRTADPLDIGKLPPIGVIISKESDTTCTVQWAGETPAVFSGLVTGEIYFLGEDGQPIKPPPAPTGADVFVQPVAVAISDEKLFVKIDLHKTKRVA